MADVFADDGEAAFGSFGDDMVTDHAHRAAGFESSDRTVHGIEGALGNSASIIGDVTHEEGFRLVAMPTVDDGGDIHVNDIAVLEDIAIRNSVADHIINAGTAGFRVAKVSECGGLVFMSNGVFMDQPVDFFSSDAGLDEGANVIHELGIEFPGSAHPVALRLRQLKFSEILQHVQGKNLYSNKVRSGKRERTNLPKNVANPTPHREQGTGLPNPQRKRGTGFGQDPFE